jgi:hypothetical protein
MHMSVTVRTIPHPLTKETLSCAANSVGRIDAVLNTTCLVLSRGLAREMYLWYNINAEHSRERRFDLPDFHELSTCQHALNSPFRKFAAIIFHFCRNDSTALGI